MLAGSVFYNFFSNAFESDFTLVYHFGRLPVVGAIEDEVGDVVGNIQLLIFFFFFFARVRFCFTLLKYIVYSRMTPTFLLLVVSVFLFNCSYLLDVL